MKLKLSLLLTSLILVVSILMTSCASRATDSNVIDAQINENGELILTYENGEQHNLGVVVGDQGEDGATGAAGKDGTNAGKGADGKNGVDGADGKLVITSDGSSIPAASAKGLRSAVSIITTFKKTVQQGGYRPGAGSTTTQEYAAAGSGVIYKMNRGDGDAYIITNYHVVYDSSSNTANGISDDIKVYLYGSEIEGKAMSATYVGGSLYYDIAVLHIDNNDILRESDAIAVDIADSDLVRVGDTAIAIGNAKGYGTSASLGVVCVDSEYINMYAADNKTQVSFRVMRVDAAVNSGNSGGGLYDNEGNLIGIVNAKEIEDGVENIGYAIPSKVAVSVADNIIHYCAGTSVERVQRSMIEIYVSITD